VDKEETYKKGGIMKNNLVFAPLVRVSTEVQARMGESLSTQRKQLEFAIKTLNGVIYKWYSGPEQSEI
jgi:hypothetical protein